MVLDMGGTRRRVVVDFRDLVEFDEVAYSGPMCTARLTSRPPTLPGRRCSPSGPASVWARDWRSARMHEPLPWVRWRTAPIAVPVTVSSRRRAAALSSGTTAVGRPCLRWILTAPPRPGPSNCSTPQTGAMRRPPARPTPSGPPSCVRRRSSTGNGFSGGFVGGSAADRARYADLLLNRPVRRHAWIERTIASTVAFNNAAVWGCLGWKLGQYLALGKAIISTPLHNVLPEPLIHGRHLHVVGDPDEFPAAIEHLRTDGNYRRELERGALSYWHRWLAPKVVAARILTAAEST